MENKYSWQDVVNILPEHIQQNFKNNIIKNLNLKNENKLEFDACDVAVGARRTLRFGRGTFRSRGVADGSRFASVI